MNYNFENIKNFIEQELGINTQNAKSKFEPIVVKLTKVQLDKNVEFTSDGIFYTDSNGKKHKGFLYIESGYNQQTIEKAKTSVPKFHVVNCETIQMQKNRLNFNGHYVFATEKIEMVDKYDGITKEPTVCGYCSKISKNVYRGMTTSQFKNEVILKNEIEEGFFDTDLPKDVPIDDYGYTNDWDDQSKQYRLRKKFTCEQCGIKLNESYIDGYYLETHHISGIKTDNREDNLICLCTLCHANVDEIHQKNFNELKNKQKLNDFIELYRDRLIAVKNPFLKSK